MKETFTDRLVGGIIYAILTVILLIILYPLVFVVSASISDPLSVTKGEMWLFPKNLSFIGYELIFANKEIWIGYKNTIIYTVVGTSVNLIMTIMAAYPLSRKDFAGRNVITGYIVFTMFFSGGLIPTYLLVKNLGMINSMWALIIPGAVSVWNIIIMRTFFQTSIPNEIQESAAIDGCSNLQTLWKIVLPLSMPVIAVMILFYSVGHWNAYFNALIYLNDRDKYPLQLFLREILIKSEVDNMAGGMDLSVQKHLMEAEAIKYAIVIVANLPVLAVYPFLQKYFTKGFLVGAIKG
ncbi:Inner membrane ABC transporter permease protein ycjP [Chlamydia abortus]|uniref:Carbohydrate ABC transporter permease n=1 Tax=Paenibacillus residui TaxID=629724 RepID=A0ABW3DGY3_9BACL|nr:MULTISPECIES: carbohydrate ABC transporter permease [Paenibacillaceae]SHE12785.1 Inner membrane ABC transporter permease protein ycjP [Chlamydia abortus]